MWLHWKLCGAWLQIKAQCKNSKLVYHHLPGCSLWLPLLHAFSSSRSNPLPWKRRSTLAVWVHEGHFGEFITSGNPKIPTETSSWMKYVPKYWITTYHLLLQQAAVALRVLPLCENELVETQQEAHAFAVVELCILWLMVTIITCLEHK